MPESGGKLRVKRRYAAMAVAYAASGGSLALAAAAQLITFAVLARSLGVDQFALFVTLGAISNVAVYLCGLGSAETLVRRVAREPRLYPVMLGHTLVLSALSGAALIAIALIVLPQVFPISPDPLVNYGGTALFLIANIVLVRTIQTTEQIFIAHFRFAAANHVVAGFALLRTATALLACLVFGTASLAAWAVWQCAAHGIAAGLCLWSLRGFGRPRLGIVREEVRTGLYFSVPIIMRALRLNADLMILQVFATAEILASYSLARRLLEASYLPVDALHRLLYPGSAVAAARGLHGAMDRTLRILATVTTIAVATAIGVYLIAPELPALFGHAYPSLVPFVQALCWAVIVLGIWSAPLEALGASGHHATRALILAVGCVAGAALTAFLAARDPASGVVTGFYLTEIGMAAATWAALIRIVRHGRAAGGARATGFRPVAQQQPIAVEM
ncbi:hypothetical protein sos41_11250 [Alphaproteobacteria bacterium SO-S41]|nr:hypothetical protein sos41_11250 [Alphaproteobacteria bacterium SO-S41]